MWARDLVRTFGNLCTIGATGVFLVLDFQRKHSLRRHGGAILLGGLSVALLNARGEAGFQNGTFVYAAVVLLAVAVAHALAGTTARAPVLISVCALLMVAASEW